MSIQRNLRRPVWPLRSIAALLIAFGVFAAPASASKNRTLQLEEGVRGQRTIEAVINGRNTKALVDTGATVPLIDLAYLESEIEDVNGLPQTRILGIGGEREYRLGEISELVIGSDRWNGLKTAVNEINRVPVREPVLPANLFETRVVDFDFINQRLHLYDGRPRHVSNSYRSTLKYSDFNTLPFIEVSINGVKGKALIDTGADVTFMTKAYAEAARGRLDDEAMKRIRGSDLKTKPADIFVFRDFEVGHSTMEKVSLPAPDTDLFETLGVDHEYCMVIGMDFLQYFRMQIDRKRSEIRFIRTATTSGSRAKRGNASMTVKTIVPR